MQNKNPEDANKSLSPVQWASQHAPTNKLQLALLPVSRSTAVRVHRWTRVWTLTSNSIARCRCCGLTREYAAYQGGILVRYSSGARTLAFGRLGKVPAPDCDGDSLPSYPAEFEFARVDV